MHIQFHKLQTNRERTYLYIQFRGPGWSNHSQADPWGARMRVWRSDSLAKTRLPAGTHVASVVTPVAWPLCSVGITAES
ncbi:hypothetical protein, partial [Leptospira meyeri]|uniref:hypothetical protein n=1 Tax=Leptospira meyeri TaxID=29508 RepID=UPI001A9C5B2B